MFWTALLGVCAFACILISFITQGKQTSNQGSQNRQKIYIQDRIAINEKLYEFTANTDQGTIKFENSIPFPIGSYIDADIHNDQITVYSENVQQNQIFRVLNHVEKWRWTGILLLLASMSTAIMQSDKFETVIAGFCIIIAIAITMLVVIRSKNKYYEYCQEEAAGHMIDIPYEIIAANKNKSYISYTNNEDLLVVAVLPKRYLKRHPETIVYHTVSKSVVLTSKKMLKITNIVSLICAGVFAICIAALYILDRLQ